MKTKTQAFTQISILNRNFYGRLDREKPLVSTMILQVLACVLLSFSMINQAHSASMTFATDTTITQDETISNGEIWTINEGVTLTIPQGITVFLSFEGEIINNGGIINNSGEIFLAESGLDNVEGIINNTGSIRISEGNIINSDGTINNSDSGTIEIDLGFIRNTNSGLIDNAGTITIEEGSEIENSGTIVLRLNGVINNNDGTINNSGVIRFDDFGGGIDNVEGIITNSGTIDAGQGAITNSGGTIINNSGGTIFKTAGFLTNINSGMIDNFGIINFQDDSTIDNSGTINNSGTILNLESSFIINSGTINNAESGIINNDLDATITNTGTINNDSSFIDNTGTINNDGTIDNCPDGEPGTITGPITGNQPIECQGGPTPLSFTPIADATIKLNKPKENFGADREIQTDNRPMQDFLIKFNVSGIGVRHIQSAKLRLFCTNKSNRGGDFHMVGNDWSEDTVTWDNAPPEIPDAIASLGPVVRLTWVEVDLTSLITEDGVYSLRVMSPSRDGADYRSKEKPGLEPELILMLE